ncbi:MAG: transposase [Thermoanaerobaculales bacterium]
MTVARSQLVDLDVTSYYHCISRCVRKAFLCGEGNEHRKGWIEDRLEELAGIFAVSVCGFSVMDNHLHLVVRLEGLDRVDRWSDREVVERWGRLYPPRDRKRKPLPVTKAWVKQKLDDAAWLARTRKRLANLGWFMKCLKEPLARMANKEDKCRGAFWEARYKSIAILDTEALLATCAYVDLNPVAAGLAQAPEESDHTSIKARIETCRQHGQMPTLQQALAETAQGRALAPYAARQLERQGWLVPFAEGADEGETTPERLGMLSGFSLAQYLHLIDWTSRLAREGKAHVSAQIDSILARLGTSADTWTGTLARLFKRDRLLGVAFSFSRDRLRRAATHRGCHHLANLCGCQV